MLTVDFSEQNAHTIWQEYGDRDRYVNWILQTQKVQIVMSAGCVQNKRDLYPQRGNIWKSPPLVSSKLKARLRYERTWSKASLAKAGWFRHIHRDANFSCSSSTHLPWFNIVTQPSLWELQKNSGAYKWQWFLVFFWISIAWLCEIVIGSLAFCSPCHDILYICKLKGMRGPGLEGAPYLSSLHSQPL